MSKKLFIGVVVIGVIHFLFLQHQTKVVVLPSSEEVFYIGGMCVNPDSL